MTVAPKVGYVVRDPVPIVQTAKPSTKGEGDSPDCAVEPPTRDLKGYAAKLWDHYHAELTCMYGEVNLFMLEEYCYTAQELRDKQNELDVEGSYIHTKEGMKPHPLVSVTTKWQAEKRRLESELGIGAKNKKNMKRLDAGGGEKADNPILGKYGS